jgi:hypothetical protein
VELIIAKFGQLTNNKIMKKILLNSALALGVLVSVSATAQERYLDEIFTDVNVAPGLVYGQGKFVFASNVEDLVLSGLPKTGNLQMDVYSPDGDTETNRAVVVVLHTGNFLPRFFNKSTTGSRKDKSVVTLCNKLAKRGFVAVAISYRLGWDPLATLEETRKATLLNAVYRGLSDVKTSVRYLKKSVAENSNPYGIDPNKITLFGYGTGGYLASSYGALDRVSELEIEKFVTSEGDIFVDISTAGNVDGSGGDTAVNIVNHTGYCNDVMACVNAGGAVGDSTWIEAGETPVISFHCPDDPFAPFVYGMVIVPTTNGNVVPVSGSRYIIGRANELGNNDVFAGPYTDPYSVAAASALASSHPSLGLVPADYQGLFPFVRPTVEPGREEASPWDFWVPAEIEATVAGINNLVPPESQLDAATILAGSLNNNPDMSQAKGESYIDSIVGYMSPRLVSAMATANGGDCQEVSVQELVESNTMVYPNPAQDYFVVNTRENITISSVEVFNMTGALVSSEFGINAMSRQINVAGLTPGLYLLRVTTDSGIVTRKLSKN